MKMIMQVSKDKYELPLNIAKSVGEMHRISGIDRSTIYKALKRNLRGMKSSFVYVEVEDDG